LSPLLSNIMLNDLDHELEKRGHCFCRYADDCAPRVQNRLTRCFARNCVTDEGRRTPRDLLTGAGSKSPSAAVVKSHGGEHQKEKARKEPGQMSNRKLNESEPSDDVSKA
jgi:hypothetical protein